MCLDTSEEMSRSLELQLCVQDLQVQTLQLGCGGVCAWMVPRQPSRNYGVDTDIRNSQWNVLCCTLPIELQTSCCNVCRIILLMLHLQNARW